MGTVCSDPLPDSLIGVVSAPLAGQPDVPGTADGVGATARFTSATGLLLSSDGRSLYALDKERVCRTDLVTGWVDTLATLGVTGSNVSQLALLPQGCLAVCIPYHERLHVLRGPKFAGAAVPPALPLTASFRHPRNLAALLQQCPIGPSCASLCLRDRVYVVNRAVLAARSGYFRRLLEGGFTDSTAEELELDETEPEAFANLLACMYTGALEVPEQQLHSTLELASRLVMPGAAKELQQRLLAVASPATLLSDMVWAEGEILRELVARLKVQGVRQ